jgi:SP family sugar porter-like MFS transporter
MTSNLALTHGKLQVGVGLMILQQFGGSNGIVFYASSIFKLAGS